MPTLSVCSNCRNTCAKCHNRTNASHPVWVCMDCNRQYNGKCCVCGGKKTGPGSVGATGPGKTCKKCFKSPFICILCGAKH